MYVKKIGKCSKPIIVFYRFVAIRAVLDGKNEWRKSEIEYESMISDR